MKRKLNRSDSVSAALDLSRVPAKVQVSLRMDEDLLLWLKSFGPGWTTRVNRLLRAAYRRRRRK